MAHGAEQRPVDIAAVGRCGLCQCGRSRCEGLPGQQQQWHEKNECRTTQKLICAAPAEMVDKDLRQRQQDQDTGAGSRIDHGHRGWQPRSEPSSEQDGIRHISDAGRAESDAQTEGELKLPEVLGEGCGEKCTAQHEQSNGINCSRTRVVEQAAYSWIGEAGRQCRHGVNRDDLGAIPSEALRNRQQEDRETLAESAPEHR